MIVGYVHTTCSSVSTKETIVKEHPELAMKLILLGTGVVGQWEKNKWDTLWLCQT